MKAKVSFEKLINYIYEESNNTLRKGIDALDNLDLCVADSHVKKIKELSLAISWIEDFLEKSVTDWHRRDKAKELFRIAAKAHAEILDMSFDLQNEYKNWSTYIKNGTNN